MASRDVTEFALAAPPRPDSAAIRRAMSADAAARDQLREYVVHRCHEACLPPWNWERLADDVMAWLELQRPAGRVNRRAFETHLDKLLREAWRQAGWQQDPRKRDLSGQPSEVVNALAYFGLPAARPLLDACTENDRRDFAHPRNAARYRELALLCHVGGLGIGEVARVTGAARSKVKKARSETVRWLLDVRLRSKVWKAPSWQEQFPAVPRGAWQEQMLTPWDVAARGVVTPEQILAMLSHATYERLVRMGHYDALDRILSAMAAVSPVREALRSARRISGSRKIGLARLHMNLGKNFHNSGDLDDAERAYECAAALLAQLESVRARALRVELDSLLGRTLEQRARQRIEPTGVPRPDDPHLEQARSLYAHGVRLADQLLREADPEEGVGHYMRVSRTYCWLRLGNVSRLRGRFVRARQLYLESLVAFLELQYPIGVGHTVRELGNWFLDRARICPADSEAPGATKTVLAWQAHAFFWNLAVWLTMPGPYSRGMVDAVIRGALAAKTAGDADACSALTELADDLCQHLFAQDRSLSHLRELL